MSVGNSTSRDAVAESFIRYVLEIGAIEFPTEGRSLRSGRLSPYFFNSGLFTKGEYIGNLAELYSRAIRLHTHLNPDVIFGPAYKGIPLAVTIAESLGSYVEYAFNRKEPKGHGEGGEIVGATLEGKRVVIVDDVITTGGSATEALASVLKHGGIPVGCVIAFDRQERAHDESDYSAVQEFHRKNRIPVYSIATTSHLIAYLEQSHTPKMYRDIPKEIVLGKLTSYFEKYRSKILS